MAILIVAVFPSRLSRYTASQADQHLHRAGRSEARHQGGRRRHLARQLHALCIPAISTWSRRPCNPSTTRSARGCYLCLRYVPLPMCPDRTADSPVEGAGFEPVWGFSCQAVVLGCADSFLFGAGKAVFRPVACDQVRGARGRGQGTETVAKLGGVPPSVACVSQRLDA
jgi:hypothetical protein